mgnify:FL=1
MDDVLEEAQRHVRDVEQQEMVKLQQEHLVEMGGSLPAPEEDDSEELQAKELELEQQQREIRELQELLERERAENQRIQEESQLAEEEAAQQEEQELAAEKEDDMDDFADIAGQAKSLVDKELARERRQKELLERKKQDQLRKLEQRRMRIQGKKFEAARAELAKTPSGKVALAARASLAARGVGKKWLEKARRAKEAAAGRGDAGDEDEDETGTGARVRVVIDSAGQGDDDVDGGAGPSGVEQQLGDLDVPGQKQQQKKKKMPSIDEKVFTRIVNSSPWFVVLERMERQLKDAIARPLDPPSNVAAGDDAPATAAAVLTGELLQREVELSEQERRLELEESQVKEKMAAAKEKKRMMRQQQQKQQDQGEVVAAAAPIFADDIEQELQRGQTLRVANPSECGDLASAVYQFSQSILATLKEAALRVGAVSVSL